MRSNDRCARWFGADVVAVVCSERQLRAAILSRKLQRRGTVHISLAQRGGRTRWQTSGSAPGIAQTLGRPLRVGDTVTVRGRGRRARMLVRARSASRIVESLFRGVSLSSKRPTRAKAVKRGGRVYVTLIRPNGRRVNADRTVRLKVR